MSDRPIVTNAPTGRVPWRQAFAAFRHRNYRLFYTGQGISLIGTWMHSVALGWLVYDITRSSLTLGVVNFLAALPVTILSMVGGNIADRVSKRRILVWTQITSLVLALTLAALVWLGWIQIWQVAAIGIGLGIANAFDIPARQSFVIEMVGKDDLMNALALNSSMFHAARVIGPALAGVLIGTVGAAGCFLLNGLSYLAVIAGYLRMNLPAREPHPTPPSVWHGTLEAVRYARQHPRVRRILIPLAVCSLFGFPYMTLMPVFARDILHGNARTLGFLTAANGFGALIGALIVATIGDRLPRHKLFPACIVLWSLFSGLFAHSTSVWLSSVFLVLSGIHFIVGMATANTTVQLSVPDKLRGRVMGLYTLAFIGVSPFGSLLLGAAARAWTAPWAITSGMAICFLTGLAHLLLPERLDFTGDSNERDGL